MTDAQAKEVTMVALNVSYTAFLHRCRNILGRDRYVSVWANSRGTCCSPAIGPGEFEHNPLWLWARFLRARIKYGNAEVLSLPKQL